MDWEEIEKAIVVYINTWSTTPVMWPGQSVRPTDTSWIEVHIMTESQTFVRKGDKDRGSLLIQIGIFSRSENVYILSTLYKALSTFLHQKDLKSTNYQIRFGEMSAEPIVWRGSDNIEKDLKYLACTTQASIWEV